jgi:hypothetical protein
MYLLMATNLDIIRGALRLLGVLAETEEPSSEDSQLALEALNGFLEDWTAEGIDVGQWPQTDVDADFPGSSTTEHTAKAYLAVQLAPYYERQPNPVVVLSASRGYERLVRETVTAQMQPASMSHLPAAQSTWDIEGG